MKRGEERRQKTFDNTWKINEIRDRDAFFSNLKNRKKKGAREVQGRGGAAIRPVFVLLTPSLSSLRHL